MRERSHFICAIRPVESFSEAEAFFAEVRKKHHAARHNVPIYLAGGVGFASGADKPIEYASDDGEPHGSAGAPILSYLKNENIRGLALVVTRYFGGVKLGTGGLVRAYTDAARLGVEAAGLCEARVLGVFEFEADYAGYEKLCASFAGKQQGGDAIGVRNPVFGEGVKAELVFEPGEKKPVLAAMQAAGAKVLREFTIIAKNSPVIARSFMRPIRS